MVSHIEKHGKRPINPHNGKFASKTRRDDMGTLKQAKAAIKKGYGTHIGIVLWKEHFDDDLVCLDLDDPAKQKDPDNTYRDIAKLAKRAEKDFLIVEKSLSGKAFHLWAMGLQRKDCPLHHAKANVEYFDGSESHYAILTMDPELIYDAVMTDGTAYFQKVCKELGGWEKQRQKKSNNRSSDKNVKLPFKDVLEVLGEPERIDRSGEHWYSCPHPDHTDKEPSFSVRDNDGVADFNCFVCDTPEDNKTGRLIARMVGVSTDKELNESAFADLFVEKYGEDYLYTIKSKKWWRYWNGVWHQDDVAYLRDMEETIQECLPDVDFDDKNTMAIRSRWLKETVFANCAKIASRRKGIVCRPEELDKHDHLLGVPGGKVWDYATNQIRDATREDRITHTLNVTPDLRAPRKHTFFDKTLLGYLKSGYKTREETQKARLGILEHIGAALACDKSFQSFLVVVGPPRGGKSTLIKFIRHALGEYGGSISGTKLTARFESHDTWKLVTEHSRLVVATELAKGGVFQSEFLSELVEQDSPIRARGMREDEREFVPKASLILACNELPRGSGGLFRRIYPIYFAKRILEEKVDKNLGEKLQKDAPALLAAAREAYLRACENGALTTPQKMKDDRKAYMAQSEPHIAFAMDCVRHDPGGFVMSANLYKCYREWCEENGLKPMQQRKLTRQIADLYDDAEAKKMRVDESGQLLTVGKPENGVSNIRLRYGTEGTF